MPAPPLETLLGGLTVRQFLARHWQRRALLVRGAWPGLRDPLTVSGLFRIAARDDCETRIVAHGRGGWTLERGPFPARRRRSLPDERWTLLVQGLNLVAPAAEDMMRAFRFVPFARLDDVMVSYAARGGGVGPHVDSYDVFLLQGGGRRRWRIATRGDRSLDPRAPLKILKRFRAEREWVLEAGDMLYLPPGVAHEGTALEPCFTYSIGFRAPSVRDLAAEFLAFLPDHLPLSERLYADPDLRPTRAPARIDDAFLRRIAAMLTAVRWSPRDVAAFAGRYFSEPKPHVRFAPPARPLGASAFARAVARSGVSLAPATGMLYRGAHLYINGETAAARGATAAVLRRLADRRVLPGGTSVTSAAAALLYTWYLAGYLAPGAPHG